MDGSFLFIIVALFAFMYLLLIRPQRQQQRRHTEMVEALKPGDEVITVGGLYGDITEVQPDRVTLEIAEDIHVEVTKRAIATVVPPAEAAERDEEADAAEAETDPTASPPVAEEDSARR